MSDLLTAMQDYTSNLDLGPAPPVRLMQEAADALSQTTHGKVQGSIFTLNPGGANLFRHTFYLRAPDLNDYTYSLFYVWHDENFYPAHVLRAGEDQRTDTHDCTDENALREELKIIFQDHDTRQVVRSLLIQMSNQGAGSAGP